MAFGGRKLRVAKAGLLLNQSAGDPYVPGYERTEGQSKVIQHAMMKGLQFSGSIAGELVPMFDLPGRKLHQILVDDVANVFQVDCKLDDLHGATTILLVESFSSHLGDVELDRFVETVGSVVHLRDLYDELPLVRHQGRHGLSKHRLDDISHVKRLAGRGSQRQCGCADRALVQIERA